jgi:uncharacterized protein (TIGR03435 family)
MRVVPAAGTGLVFVLVGSVIAAPVAQQTKPAFEVASIRRNASQALYYGQHRIQPGGRFVTTNARPTELIQFAYDVLDVQVLGAPDWATTERFDITATAADRSSSHSQMRLMLQSLLEERFQLVVRKEQREIPLYDLTLDRRDGRLGPGLVKMGSQDECETARKNQPRKPAPAGAITLRSCSSIATVMKEISLVFLRAPVVNRTGLDGTLSFSTYFAPTPDLLAPATDARREAIDPNLPSLFTALREDLGLRLNATRGMGDVVVVESIERPTEN